MAVHDKQRILPVKRAGRDVILLDQRLLPSEVVFHHVDGPEEMTQYIKVLAVRGAPAIGIAGAYGMYLAARNCGSPERLDHDIRAAGEMLSKARPTAVNLQWAIDRQLKVFSRVQFEYDGAEALQQARLSLGDEADAILSEDIDLCQRIGKYGSELLSDGMTVLTHCNAGGIATSGYGTALAPIYVAQESGKRIKVLADETRPLFQGMRLTAWELINSGVDVTVICDNAAPFLMSQGKVDCVIVGADRIAVNGDTANKIGTYGVALAAKAHGIPFYVAAPHSTFDPALPDGSGIPIEQRSPEEVTCWKGTSLAPPGVRVFNPAFDVTPADLITGIITDEGVLRPAFMESIPAFLKKFRS